jgi:acetyl esterase/lipase
MRLFQLYLALAMTTLLAGPIAAVASAVDNTAAGYGASPKSMFALTEIAPPPEDHSAIKLAGKSANSTSESWFNLRGNDASGFTGVMITRSVSEASITPFLPDPSKGTGAAIVVAPGGGTVVLSMDAQGYRIARWLNERGIAAFVLKYRLVTTPADPNEFLKMLPPLSPPYDGPPAKHPDLFR